MWDTWKLSPEKCPYSNTVTNGIFYVRIPTAITVNYESAIERENSVEALLHKMKNASGEELGKHVGRLQTDLGSFGNFGGVDMTGFGERMMATGGPRGMTDLGSTLGKITNLVKPREDDDEGDDDEDEGAAGGDAGEAPEGSPSKKARKGEKPGVGGSPKEPKWWNRPAFQVEREADISEAMTKLLEEMLAAKDSLRKVVEDVRVFCLYFVLTMKS